MNKQFKMIRNYPALILLFIYAGLLMQGCSKATNEGTLVSGNKTQLTVSVIGVVDDGIIGSKAQSSATKATVKPGLAVPSEIVSHKEGFDSRFSVVEDQFQGDKMVSISNNDKEGTNTTLRAESIPNGIYYHLIVYKVSDNAVVASQVMRSGDAVQITVDGGVQYKWVAFSYNTALAADLPTVDPVAPVVSMGQNKDFLYASGTITVNAYNTPLGIVFSHKLARIGVELNTKGMFADLNTATIVNENQLKTGNFNLLTGAVTGALSTIATATASTFIRPTGYSFDDRSTAYFYTADPTSLANLNMKLTGLSVKLDAYAVSQSQATRNFGVLSTVYSSPNFVPVLGQSKTFKIDLLESPITTTSNNGGAIVTRWARANLYYAGAADHNPYRFHHLNQQTQDANTFFAFGAIYPQTYATEGGESDPCALVYPVGVWRQATQLDYQGLVGRGLLEGGIITAKTPTRVAGQYLEYAAAGTASPYPTNAVRFNLNGSAVGLSLVAGLIDLSFGFYGQNAEVWTSTKLLNIPPLLSLGAIHYDASGTTHSLTTDILDLQLLGAVNVVKSNFMNVRCVRN